MLDVCPGCGAYAPDKSVAPDGSDASGRAAIASCPRCGHEVRFLRMPLFLVTGASGAGKTTASESIPTRLPECVVLESDILWRTEFDTPGDDYRDFHDTWLRMAKNIQQCGRPVVLCGTALPSQLEPNVQRRFFSRLHYLALVCKDWAVLRERLEKRPAWRYDGAGRDAAIRRAVEFNLWLQENAATTTPSMALLDTSRSTRDEVATEVVAWVRMNLRGHAGT